MKSGDQVCNQQPYEAGPINFDLLVNQITPHIILQSHLLISFYYNVSHRRTSGYILV